MERTVQVYRGNSNETPWTEDEIAKLREWWPELSQTEMAKRLKRSKSSVGGKLKRIGLFKSETQMPINGNTRSRREKAKENRKRIDSMANGTLPPLPSLSFPEEK